MRAGLSGRTDRLRRVAQIVGAGSFAVLVGASATSAGREIYEYRVVHSAHGDIGNYTNVVERRGDDTEVRTELHIAVKILGIVAYREEAQRIERWHRQQLVSFDGVTLINGERLEVRGEARDRGFVITTPTGTVSAPANVHPSNPWSVMVLNSEAMMSTRTGKLFTGSVKGGEARLVTLDGRTLWLRQFEVVSDKHELVWFDDHGVPVAFRTEEGGSDVDFILSHRQTIAAGPN